MRTFENDLGQSIEIIRYRRLSWLLHKGDTVFQLKDTGVPFLDLTKIDEDEEMDKIGRQHLSAQMVDPECKTQQT